MSKECIKIESIGTHLTLYEQNWWLITDHITSSACIPHDIAGVDRVLWCGSC